jgi:general secretion pathway protein A
MYARFFGLKQPPFSIAPDPRYLYMSERHREALAHLLYGVRGGGGFVVLTGEIGAGKTTVCRCFLEQVPQRCNVAYIFNPKLTVEELLRTVCEEFGIPYRHEGPGVPTVKDYVDALNEYLLRTHAVGHDNVLIIDEAQNLSAEVLEQLRLLTNLETNERKLLQIVLIGQPELRTMLAQPGLQQLAQRVIARYHLGALSEAETSQYVRHRLAVAGLTRELPFDGRALRRIYRYSGGIPRRINLLSDRSLLGAYAKQSASVGPDIVDRAAAEVLDPPALASLRRRDPWRTAALGFGLVAVAVLAVVLEGSVPDPGSIKSSADSDASPVALVVPPVAAGMTPSAAAPEPAAPIAPSEPTAFDLPTGFASLVEAERTWRELAREWNLVLSDGDPCRAAVKQQVHCFKRTNATLALIRQLDRPVILTLRDARGRAAYALLDGLSSRTALLRVDGMARTVALVSLADYWRGEFATLWRVPPDYSGSTADFRAGPAAHWLASQLATVRGEPLPNNKRVDARTLKDWIYSFQLAQGLPLDGVAGPITLMLLNRAAGVDEPHLQKVE